MLASGVKESSVLITSDHAKLPPDVTALLDPAVPLPAGVRFFEKRYEYAEMIGRVFWAIGLIVAAVFIIPFGVYSIVFDLRHASQHTSVSYLPLGFGLVCALGAWMIASSVLTCAHLRGQQLSGKPTRRGTFLRSDVLIQHGESDTTIIPLADFRGLSGRDVKYFHNNAEKSYRLPAAWMNATTDEVCAAVASWPRIAGSTAAGV